MSNRPLTMAVSTSGLTAPLKSGAIPVGRHQLHCVEIEPITAAMRRMVRGLEFDICEMAVTTYLCARAHGKPITAIPVFVTRNFHHWAAFTTNQAKIGAPKDLEGRRVAVNRGYTVTTGVWVRGILQTEYGVDLGRITWVPTDDEHVAEFTSPGNVDLSCRGKSASDLLSSGACAAAIGDVRAQSPLIRRSLQMRAQPASTISAGRASTRSIIQSPLATPCSPSDPGSRGNFLRPSCGRRWNTIPGSVIRRRVRRRTPDLPRSITFWALSLFPTASMPTARRSTRSRHLLSISKFYAKRWRSPTCLRRLSERRITWGALFVRWHRGGDIALPPQPGAGLTDRLQPAIGAQSSSQDRCEWRSCMRRQTRVAAHAERPH
jgi:hypothetical protein